jgi:hypothetical protein
LDQSKKAKEKQCSSELLGEFTRGTVFELTGRFLVIDWQIIESFILTQFDAIRKRFERASHFTGNDPEERESNYFKTY